MFSSRYMHFIRVAAMHVQDCKFNEVVEGNDAVEQVLYMFEI